MPLAKRTSMSSILKGEPDAASFRPSSRVLQRSGGHTHDIFSVSSSSSDASSDVRPVSAKRDPNAASAGDIFGKRE